MNEAFGGPLYQMLNPAAQQLVDRIGMRGQGLSGMMAESIGPGGRIKLSAAALKKVKPLVQNLQREIKLTQNIDPNERAAAEKAVQRIKKQIDKIVKDDQS